MLRRSYVVLAALATLFLALPLSADWDNYKLPADAYLKDGALVAAGTPGAIKIPKGTPVCRDRDTGVWIKGPYTTASPVTIGCNWLTVWVPWLGTAQAQQVTTGIYNRIFPTNVPVGSPPAGPPTLSAPWLQTDIGSPPVAGNAFDAQNVLTITGSGDFHKDTSAFHLVYQLKSGNWRIDFPLTSLTGSDDYRSCGPAILDALAVDTKYTYLTPNFANGKAAFGIRTTTGAGVYESQTYSAGAFSVGILRLEIIGSTHTGYISTDNGMTFTQVGAGTWTPTGPTFAIGIHDDSGVASTLSTCQGIKPTLTSLSSAGPGVLQFTNAVGVVAATSSTTETAGTVSLPCLTRSVDTSGAISGDIQNAGTGSAIAGTDFTNPPYPQTKSWANGEGGTKCGSVAILNRAGSQIARTVNYTLGNLTGGVTAGAQATHTLTIADSNLVAIKYQPGIYAGFNKTCIPYDGVRFGCTKAELLQNISQEVCANPDVQGLKIGGLPSFFAADTVGSYTGTNPDRGFAIFDAVLDALAACSKNLIIQSYHTVQVNLPSQQAQYFPKFTYPASFNSDGTAAPGTFGFWPDSQASQPSGWSAKIGRTDWRDFAIATTAAYCARYGPGGVHESPAFYAISMVYWNTSLPINAPLPSDYDEATVNTRFREYLAGARAACPTINIMATLDFANPFPAQMTTHLIDMRDNTKAVMANTDVLTAAQGPTWGQQVYAGSAGSPSLFDFRHVVRDFEEVESPDMCGSHFGNHSPASIYDVLQNGDVSQLPRRPGTIIVFQATECDPGFGWAAWKQLLATFGGATVFDGVSSTRRTPAYVKANGCETSQTCQ